MKTHCRISFDNDKTWYWATCLNFGEISMPHRVYMPFGKVLVSKMYQVLGSYHCKNYQKRRKPIII